MPRKPLGEVAMTATERQVRWRANLSKAAKAKRRAQRRHAYAEQNEDAYFTCPEAVISLLHLEHPYLPHALLEPCAGDGAISILLQRAGYDVVTSDIRDHGLPGCQIGDYFKLAPPPGIEGVVTNPPYKRAQRFLEKALADARYVALLLRSNLYEGLSVKGGLVLTSMASPLTIRRLGRFRAGPIRNGSILLSRGRAPGASTYIRQLHDGLPQSCIHDADDRRDGFTLFAGVAKGANRILDFPSPPSSRPIGPKLDDGGEVPK